MTFGQEALFHGGETSPAAMQGFFLANNLHAGHSTNTRTEK